MSEKGYRPDPEDIRALEKFREPPSNVGEVRSMLGFLSYYRGHVSNFAKKLKPVYDLVKWKEPAGSHTKVSYDKKRSILWSPELQGIVDDVIDTLNSPPVMAYPDFDLPFILNCDASGYGLGAVLYQRQNEELRVISYASRTLTEAEQRYHLHSGKLEFLALKWSVCDKFSDYLGHGSTFSVYTDNNPLTYVMSTAKLNATGMRWVGELSEYNFTLHYRPGKNSADADGLSRNPLSCEEPSIEILERECTESISRGDMCVLLSQPDICAQSVDINTLDLTSVTNMTSSGVLHSVSKEELGKRQYEDEVVRPVYEAKLAEQRPGKREVASWSRKSRLLLQQWNKLIVRDGVLLRRTERYVQIVLPASFHTTIFRELHVDMGHLSSERVEGLARQRFYWPNMRADIESFIRQKCSCVFTKKPNILEKAKLVPIPASYPFEVVSIDFLHLDKCAGGFEYVLVVCDHFTRFAQCYATKNKSGRAAAEKLFSNFILQWGFPTRIHHDRGTEWNNRLFDHLHRLTGIKASNTTPYHPMGDPIVERYNRTLINMLKSIPENEKKRWKDHLPKLTFAYNSTIHKATGFTPFFLLMGRESRLRIDGAFPDFGENGKSEPVTYSNFVANWKRRMSEAFVLANQNSDKSKQYHKTKYDNKVKCVEVGVGDRVLVRNCKPSGTGKLATFWEPEVYVVTDKRRDLPVYVVRKYGDPSSRVRVLHRNLLKSVNELTPPEAEEVVIDTGGGKKKSDKGKLSNKKLKTSRGTSETAKEDQRATEPVVVVNRDSNSDSDEDGHLVVSYGRFPGSEGPGISQNTSVPREPILGDVVDDVPPLAEDSEGENAVSEVVTDSDGQEESQSEESAEVEQVLSDEEEIESDDQIGAVARDSEEDLSVLEDTLEATTTEESILDETIEADPATTDDSDFDPASDSPPPARPSRPSRISNPPRIFTYDRIGGEPSLCRPRPRR